MSEKTEEEHGGEEIPLKEAKHAHPRIGIRAVFWTDIPIFLIGSALMTVAAVLAFVTHDEPAEPAEWSFEIWGIKAEGNTLTLGFAVLFLIVGARFLIHVLKLVVELYKEERDE